MINKSRELAYILRHNPLKANLSIDDNGYVLIKPLLNYLKISEDELNLIIDLDNKNRFSKSVDNLKIKANQGHSINLNLKFKEVIPPNILYHGTSSSHYDKIKLSNSINKMNRHHVHLSDKLDTAIQVAERWKNDFPVILEINSKDMYRDNYKFYISDNNVYLTDSIPIKYIKFRRSK
jgi:putative RNA 2'-phosphotransferase